jgi:KaiC/GvpD/RAD55 family RecA-like ATPase
MQESDQSKSQRVATGISQAHWFSPKRYLHSTDDPFEPARFSRAFDNEHAPLGTAGVCWLDQLFSGGIRLPPTSEGDSQSALTILLTGPPGTGKTTLAGELCYRWALPGVNGSEQKPMSSLYVTTEASSAWFMDNAKEYGWSAAAEKFVALEDVKEVALSDSQRVHVVSATSKAALDNWLKNNPNGPHSRIVLALRQLAYDTAEDMALLGGLKIEQKLEAGWTGDSTDVIVLDSLNTFGGNNSRDIATLQTRFAQFQRRITGGPRIAILILDSPAGTNAHGFWEYVCDVVIRLDRSYPPNTFGYMQRTIEIMKARYQTHAWGPHQYKIYERPSRKMLVGDKQSAAFRQLQRAYPFRREGGIFILPSLHFLLSRYKRENSTAEPEYLPTPVPGLSKLLKGQGFPRGRCTALMGSRGGHKSHLGFMQILSGILREELQRRTKTEWPGDGTTELLVSPERNLEKAIVISLRDDDGITRKAMNDILSEWRTNCLGSAEAKDWPDVDSLEKDDRLEIMYFPPGNITAEEFVHRVLISVQRLKHAPNDSDGRKPRINLLFNSLDQLSRRFPLCNQQQIFIAGLIQILSAEDVTSFFVTATHSGEGQDDMSGTHGLDSIAELILRFTSGKEINKDEYITSVERSIGRALEADQETCIPGVQRLVTVEVERYAGGQAAGASAILDLIKKGHPLHNICGEGLNAFAAC